MGYILSTLSNGVSKVCSFVRYRGKKPQSLGEGLQRVVRAAGGKPGKFRGYSHPLAPEAKPASSKIGEMWGVKVDGDRLNVRHYDNGVQLRYGDVVSARTCEHGGFTMPHCGNGLLGVFRTDGSMYAAQSSTKTSCGLLRDRVIGSPLTSYETAFAKDTRDAFNALEPKIYI